MSTGRPSGTVTFLFTDIEGSTRLWEERPDEMRAALAVHDAVVRDSIEAHGGYVFSTGGDGFAAAFHRAGDAVDAAQRAQAKLAATETPLSLLRVRMAVHTGEAQERDGDYFGPAVNRAARLMAAGHGGQILVSLATEELLAGQLREALVDLGERRLRDLSLPERVYQVGRTAFPPLRTVDASPGNLPLQVTSFVGREREVAELTDLVRRERLVTLTGAGGVGKTRLALQVAAELAPEIAGGAWLVELGPLADPDVVGQVILSTLGVRQREAMTVTESLVEYLAARGALLVIDNCEHLLDAAAAVVEPIMRACATTRILATSREGLGVPGERLVAVRTLPTPSIDTPLADLPQSAAVELFVDRARAADAGFELAVDTADTDRAMRLCAALEFFTWTRHTFGIHDWCQQALGLAGADEHPEAARICGLAAIGLIMTGSDMGSIDDLARRGIAAERARSVRPSHAPWTALGSVALMTGTVSEGIEAWRTAIERALDAGDPGIVAQIEANLVFALGLDDTHTEEAEALGAQALARARSAGSSSIIAWASAWLELIVFERDRVPPRTLAAEISTTARTTGSDYVVGAFGASIRVSYRHGLAEDALLTAAECFGHLRRLANLWGVWLHLPIIGLIAADHGRLDIACGCFATIPEGFTGYPELVEPLAQARSRIAAELDPTLAAQHATRVAAMTVTELADFGADSARELLDAIRAGRIVRTSV